MPETLDKMLDAMHERYGVATPLADFLYSSPSSAFLADTTTGGWVGQEAVDGQMSDHLSFKDKGVDWELWVASTGDPLPRKGRAVFADGKIRKVEVNFTGWSFAPAIAAERFTPKVPADYEGIAVIQRARVLKNVPGDDPAPAAGATKK
jgi:hypothetical protein